jgi:hypothetical protein
MSASEALSAAQLAGVAVSVEGDTLKLRAAAPPPRTVLDALARHHAGVVALLRSTDAWTAEDWQVFFRERAGIAEFDGGLRRDQAEGLAFWCCVAEWIDRASKSKMNGNAEHDLKRTASGR